MGFDTNRIHKAKNNYRAKNHVYDGFPHQTTAYPHHCICLQECCQNDSGCVCKTCPCREGKAHGEYYQQEIETLEQVINEYRSGQS